MTGVRATWRSCTEALGALCVMMTGTPMMPIWSVGSWAVAGPCQPQEIPSLVKAQGQLSWTMCTAQGMSPTRGAAPTMAELTTVAMGRMPVSSVQVGNKYSWLSLEVVFDGNKHTAYYKAHIQPSLRYPVPPKASWR